MNRQHSLPLQSSLVLALLLCMNAGLGADDAPKRKPVNHTSVEAIIRKIPANLLPPAGAEDWNDANAGAVNKWLEENIIGDSFESSRFKVDWIKKNTYRDTPKDGEAKFILKGYDVGMMFDYNKTTLPRPELIKIGRLWIEVAPSHNIFPQLFLTPEQGADVGKLVVGKTYKISGRIAKITVEDGNLEIDHFANRPRGIVGTKVRLNLDNCTIK